MTFGRHVYGLGVIALGAVGLALGNFIPGQPVPKDFPDRVVLAYVVAAFMLLGGVAIECRRTAAWGAAALTAYYALVVVVLMSGRVLLLHGGEYGAYSGAAEQLAIAAGGLIVYAATGGVAEPRGAQLARLGQCVFGGCAVLFGGAHFVYMDLTAPLVPMWLPPSQPFWGYATGIAQVAAGIAILTGVQARLAAMLLTAMYVVFTVLVHTPMLWADPLSHANWSESALNLALIGVAWATADSLSSKARRRY